MEAGALAEALREAGITHAFGVTGSGESLQLITALAERGVRYAPVATEAAAAIMAGAASTVSGCYGIAVTIKGPGLANALPGIILNHFEHRPSLTVSEAYGPERPHRWHKRLDHEALLRSVTKAVATRSLPEGGLEGLVRLSRTEIPGPVHLDLRPGAGATVAVAGADSPGAGDRKEAISLIEGARRPVVIAGSLALRRAWGEQLSSLRIPVMTTAAAKGVIDERARYSAGVFTGAGKSISPEAHLLGRADLVVGLGLRDLEVLDPSPLAAPLALFDEVDGRVMGFDPATTVIDPAESACEHALQVLLKRDWGEAEIREAREAIDEALVVDGLPGAWFAALNAQDADHALVLDTGLFCTVGEHVWEAGPSRPFVGSSNSRYMGTAIPTALGRILAQPETPVHCIVGDGGIGPHLAEFRIAAEKDLPICLTLMTDGGYGSIAAGHGMEASHVEAYEFADRSWLGVLEGLGCRTAQVTSGEEYARTLASWTAAAPFFIEARFDPTRYRQMTNEIR